LSADDFEDAAFVRWGTVLAGAVPFKFNDNVNDVYRGQVACSDGRIVTAFIKDLDRRQFANELLAAVIGSYVGLPIPPPVIARASPANLPAAKLAIADTEDFLVFASADANASPLLQVLRGDATATPEVMQRLAKWDGLGALYGFDTWVANVDRHRGNLLLGGGEQDVWLIDHGHCFTGPAWAADRLDPRKRYLNKLSLWMTPCLSPSRRAELSVAAAAVPGQLPAERLPALGVANGVEMMLGDDFGAIMTFLKRRAAYVSELSTDALGLLI
jgi:hypothetical protein